MISLVDFLLLPAMAGWKEGRKEGRLGRGLVAHVCGS